MGAQLTLTSICILTLLGCEPGKPCSCLSHAGIPEDWAHRGPVLHAWVHVRVGQDTQDQSACTNEWCVSRFQGTHIPPCAYPSTMRAEERASAGLPGVHAGKCPTL